MTYVGWAVLYEGSSDQDYFDVLIPKIMEEIVASFGVRKSRFPVAQPLYFRAEILRRLHGEHAKREMHSICVSFILTPEGEILNIHWRGVLHHTVTGCTNCVIGHLKGVSQLRRSMRPRLGYSLMVWQ